MRETTQWAAALEALFRRIRPHFKTEQTFDRAKAYLQGLLSSTERKNTWQLAELLGDKTPYALPQFLPEIRHLLWRLVLTVAPHGLSLQEKKWLTTVVLDSCLPGMESGNLKVAS